MLLSDFQKKIISAIIDGDVNDIQSFLLKFCDLNTGVNNSGNFNGYNRQFHSGITIYLPRDENLVIDRVKEFLFLWKKLEKLDLVWSIDRKASSSFPIFKKSTISDVEPFYQVINLIQDYEMLEIGFSHSLEIFKERAYKTEDEYRFSLEHQTRIDSQKWTKTIAIISISVTILLSLLNFITYSTQRTVKIINDNAFSDTIKVIVISDKDSSIQNRYLAKTDSLKLNKKK